MYHRLFLVSALLCCCSGGSAVTGPPQTVVAFAGADVFLPCSFSIPPSDEFPDVEWSKVGLLPNNVVFLYRDGCEVHAMKNPAFQYRTSFISRELQNGNISLRISGVRLSDAGTYRCLTLWKDAPRAVTEVQLLVGAVSEPKLLITSAEGGGVTLQCEAACWLPEPQITFLDDYGKIIPADEPKRHQDASGCFTVRRTLTLRDATKSVSCRVQQPETKQTRDAHTIVPDGHGRICSLTTNIAVGGGVLLLAAPLCMLAVFLWRKFGKSAKASTSSMIRQSSDESTQSSSSESRLLLHSVMVVKDDNKESITIEMLTTKVADLNSKLHEKDETILQLQKNNSQLRAAVVLPANRRGPSASADTSAPKSGGQPQKKGRRPRLTRQNSLPAPKYPTHKARSHSCPVISGLPALPTSSSASTAVKKLGSIGRSMSDACPQPRLKAKLKRQLSFVDPSTVNRILLLEDLTEESD